MIFHRIVPPASPMNHPPGDLDKIRPPWKMRFMKTGLIPLITGLTIFVGCNTQTNLVLMANEAGKTVETIVCLRHGESPRRDLGQLTCRGLNRALALTGILLAKYGSPQFIFACNPAQKVDGYNYVRALATIEPTAIRCGLPVNTQFGASEITGLQQELHKAEYKNATVFVAWEHKALDRFVKDLLTASGGNPWRVPSWPGNDFDTIFVVRITGAEGRESVAFTIDNEGLNHLADDCP
jgi:hypothetical protein